MSTPARLPFLKSIVPNFGTMLFKNGNLAGVLIDRAGIEIPPVSVASHYSQGFLFAATANEKRDRGIRLWFTICFVNAVMLPLVSCGARRPHSFHDDSSLF